MSTTPRVQLTLEFDPGAERIRGTIQHEEDDPVPFDGWVQLTSALEAALVRARARGTSETI